MGTQATLAENLEEARGFVRELGARDLRIFTSYTWGKEREVCLFWLDGTASQAK